MDTTPILAIPYPEPTDPITDYPAVAQDAAELIEALLVAARIQAAVAPDGASTDRTPALVIPATGNYLIFYGQRGGAGSINGTAQATCALYKNGVVVAGSGLAAGSSGSGVVGQYESISAIDVEAAVAGDTYQCRSAGTAAANTAWIVIFRLP